MIQYCERVYGLSQQIAMVGDPREKPRIPASVLLKAGLAMSWCRLGSLNALEMLGQSRFWKQWLGRSPASADTMGRLYAGLDPGDFRKTLHHVYSRLKRNKALCAIRGWHVAVLDGHESHASYRRHCSGCMQRTIHTDQGDRIQYYHRNVTLQLLTPSLRILLDIEPQRNGEDEVTTAMRLLERVLRAYPRAFALVLADGLYAQAPFFNLLLAHRKYVMVVLKDEQRNLYKDAAGLFAITPAQQGRYRSRRCSWWDLADLTTWPQVDVPVRVIRSQETYRVCRQLTGQVETITTEWIWVTTLPLAQAGTEQAVHLGHRRWDIENYAFNELVNEWHADHVYKHDPTAIETFLLLAFLTYNLFHAFLLLDLKPELRRGKSQRYWALLIASGLYQGMSLAGDSPP